MNAVKPLLDPDIRPMGVNDLDRVSAIERSCFSTPWSQNTFNNLLNRRDSDLWVAAVDGSVVGYAVVWFVAEEAELGNLAVMPGWRGRGLGRQLLDQSIAFASEQEASRIYLEVRPSNLAAQQLYESRGFIVVGLRRRYYRAPVEDALVMCLELDPSAT